MFISILSITYLPQLMDCFFVGYGSIAELFIDFFLHNYILTMLLGLGFAYGSFHLLERAFKVSKI